MCTDISKDELLKKFGLNVKIQRLKKGLTQEELANKLNMHLTYLAKIETGRINMSLGKILELAKILKTDINKLLTIEYD
ncbi:helix-turn-helix transcriptional regulator [bacterium]|nr:helix-turn-helix transcriptional regulator [bacterium]